MHTECTVQIIYLFSLHEMLKKLFQKEIYLTRGMHVKSGIKTAINLFTCFVLWIFYSFT